MSVSASCRDSRRLWRCLPAAVSVLGFVALFVACLAPTTVFAQGADFQRSYIEPFPRGARYRVLVLGDSLAEGLWSGLYRGFQEDANMEVINKSKPGSGFVRIDREDWSKTVDELLKDETYQIAVVMLGANDNQAIKAGKEYVKPGTDEWDELYGQRVEAFIKKLRAKKLAVYWVGLPIMRSPNQSADAEAMNNVFREKAFINGAKFIDTWNGFTDEGGSYSPYGPDMTGQVKRLRADDGAHFTMRGYLKLAHFVEKELRRDLNLAKIERNIPLAGNEEEQAKVMGREVIPGRTDPDQPAAPAAEQAGGTPEAGAPSDAAEQPQGDQAPQLQESNVGDVAVVRPVMDQALQTAQSLAPSSTASTLPETETITSELPSGLTAVATLSAVTDLSLASSRPRLPLSQRPYYKVLIRGEQPKPKSGRGDDFAWPPG